MQQDQSPQQQRYETLVVAKEQLTTDNLKMLGEQGWTIVSDPALLIFARPVSSSAEENNHKDDTYQDEILGDVVSLGPSNRTERRTRKR